MGDAIEVRDKSTIEICENTYNSNYILNADPYSTDKCKSHPLSKHSFFNLLFAADRITESQSDQNAEIKTDQGMHIPNKFIYNTILTSYTNGNIRKNKMIVRVKGSQIYRDSLFCKEQRIAREHKVGRSRQRADKREMGGRSVVHMIKISWIELTKNLISMVELEMVLKITQLKKFLPKKYKDLSSDDPHPFKELYGTEPACN